MPRRGGGVGSRDCFGCHLLALDAVDPGLVSRSPATLLDATDATDPLGGLKTLLLGPKLQQASGVGYPWEAGYLLDYLRDALPPDSFAFLRAALAAINDPAHAPDLDRFPLWRDTPALPLSRHGPARLSEGAGGDDTMLFVLHQHTADDRPREVFVS